MAIDRGYIDYLWFRELTQEEVYFVTPSKISGWQHGVEDLMRVEACAGELADEVAKLSG